MLRCMNKRASLQHILVPEPVASVKFENISDRSVTVLWSAPKQQNGILKGYTLEFMVKDSPHTRIIHNLTADTSSFFIDKLSVSIIFKMFCKKKF